MVCAVVVTRSTSSPTEMSFNPRKNPSRCAAIPMLPGLPGEAVPAIRPAPRFSVRSSVPSKTGTRIFSFVDFKDGQRRVECPQQAVLVGLNAFRRPQAESRRLELKRWSRGHLVFGGPTPLARSRSSTKQSGKRSFHQEKPPARSPGAIRRLPANIARRKLDAVFRVSQEIPSDRELIRNVRPRNFR